MSKDMDFSNRLVQLRQGAGLTQSQLEYRCGFSATLISHYENGKRKPGLENIKTLCKGLGCTATQLIGI